MKSRGYWTKDKCQEEALKYENRTEFQLKNTSAYISSRKNGWLEQICSHMIEKIKPDGYWTKERCHEEALKYKTKTEFNKNSSKAYQQSWQKGWVDDICSHMKIIGNKYKRCIYVYEFSDNSAYIGLTYNTKIRHNNHVNDVNSSVYRKIKENIFYKHIVLTEYVDVEESKKLENFYVNEYKKNKWIVLNRKKTGGIGGKFIKWTKEKCQEESLKYNTRHDLEKNNGSAYHVIIKNKWDNIMFSHMTTLQKPSGYWTKDKCLEESLKYKSRSELKEKNVAVYTIILKKNWRYEMFNHMNTKIRKPAGYWTKEKCHDEALKYETRREFKKNSTSYQRAIANNWLNEICSHMKDK